MSLRLVMAAIAVVAVPVALYAQAPAPIAPVASGKSERRVCESTIDIGSRLAAPAAATARPSTTR